MQPSEESAMLDKAEEAAFRVVQSRYFRQSKIPVMAVERELSVDAPPA